MVALPYRCSAREAGAPMTPASPVGPALARSGPASIRSLASSERGEAGLRADHRLLEAGRLEPGEQVLAARWQRVTAVAAGLEEGARSAAGVREEARPDQLSAGLEATCHLGDRLLRVGDHVQAAVGEEEIDVAIGERK